MDILSLLTTFNDAPIDSNYRLVIISVQRAKQLIRGAPQKIKSQFHKETTIALEETVLGKIEFRVGKEARDALRDAQLVRDELERSAKPTSDGGGPPTTDHVG